jgi:hypothetical protein
VDDTLVRLIVYVEYYADTTLDVPSLLFPEVVPLFSSLINAVKNASNFDLSALLRDCRDERFS